jgi:predicted peroxiredoxin
VENMTDQSPARLTVVLSTGLDDGGRKAAIAFGVAMAAQAEGTPTTVFLALEAAVIGAPTGTAGVHPRGFSEPLETYIGHFLDLGGQLEVCASCYHEYCQHLPKDDDGSPALRESARVQGLGAIAYRSMHERVVTF